LKESASDDLVSRYAILGLCDTISYQYLTDGQKDNMLCCHTTEIC